jgi:hypothetical protein
VLGKGDNCIQEIHRSTSESNFFVVVGICVLVEEGIMSSPIGIPTLTRVASSRQVIMSPASSFPSRGGYYRTHSLTEDQQAYSLARSGSYKSQYAADRAAESVSEPLLASNEKEVDLEATKLENSVSRTRLNESEKWSLQKEVRRQCMLAGPMVCVNVLQYSITVVSVAFVGHLGQLELASASIATSLAGVLGYYVLVCIISHPRF